MRKIILLVCFVIIQNLSFGAHCTGSHVISENIGWCTSGVDGYGKCLSLFVEDADRCNGDQPKKDFEDAAYLN